MDSKKSILELLVIGLLFSSLYSCSPLLSFVFGIKKPRIENHNEQINFLRKNNLDTNYVFDINKLYSDSIAGNYYDLDTFDEKSFSPIQYRVYDNYGRFVGGWEICFGSKKKLGIFDTIPPVVKGKRFSLNPNLSFEHDIKIINHYNKIPIIKNFDYVIIVFWAQSLGILSKDLLMDLEHYIKKHPDKRFLLLKVNISKILIDEK